METPTETLIFGMDKDIAAIAVTISIFFIGYFINHLVNLRTSYIKRKITKRIILLNLSKLIEQVNTQSKAFEVIHNQLDLDDYETLIYTDQMLIALDVINQIGYENSYIAFLTGFENKSKPSDKSLDHFSQLWNIVGYLVDVQKSTKLRFEEFFQKYQILDSKRNDVVVQIQDIINEFIVYDSEKIPLLKNFLTEIIDAMHEKMEKPNNTFPTETNRYIRKIREIFIKYSNETREYKEQIQPVKINSLSQDAIVKFDNLEMHTNAGKQTYLDLSATYRKKAEELKIILSTLQAN